MKNKESLQVTAIMNGGGQIFNDENRLSLNVNSKRAVALDEI